MLFAQTIAAASSLAADATAQVAAHANARFALETTLERVHERADGGAPSAELEPAHDLAPGDEVIVTVTFTNVSGHPAHDVRITTRVPPALSYVAGTAVAPGARILYSIDDGARFAPQEELAVIGDDGRQRRAQAADYTHVRWVLAVPLDPGARGTARFRAVVRDPV